MGSLSIHNLGFDISGMILYCKQLNLQHSIIFVFAATAGFSGAFKVVLGFLAGSEITSCPEGFAAGDRTNWSTEQNWSKCF